MLLLFCLLLDLLVCPPARKLVEELLRVLFGTLLCRLLKWSSLCIAAVAWLDLFILVVFVIIWLLVILKQKKALRISKLLHFPDYYRLSDTSCSSVFSPAAAQSDYLDRDTIWESGATSGERREGRMRGRRGSSAHTYCLLIRAATARYSSLLNYSNIIN